MSKSRGCCCGTDAREYMPDYSASVNHEMDDQTVGLMLGTHAPPRGCCGACNRCFTRPWVALVTLLAVLGIVAIIGGFFIAFGVQGIIQSQVNGAKFSIMAVSIAPPFSQEGFTASMQGTVQTPVGSLPVAATLGSANFSISLLRTIGGYSSEQCIGWIELPDIAVAGGGAPVYMNVSAPFRVFNNGTGWPQFAESLIKDPTVTWRLRGGGEASLDADDPCSQSTLQLTPPFARSAKVIVHVLGLMFPVSVTTDIVFSGLDGVPGVKLESFSVGGDSMALTTNLDSVMPNPSVMNLDLSSRVVFAAYFSLEPPSSHVNKSSFSFLGSIETLQPLTLAHGNNRLQLSGQVKPADVAASGEFFSQYLKGTTQQAMVVGQGCVPGANCPDWVLKLVRSLAVTLAFPGLQNFSLLQSVAAPLFQLSYAPNPPNPQEPTQQVPYARGILINSFSTPFSFPASVFKVDVTVDMVWKGTVVGHLAPGWVAATSNGTAAGGAITVPLYNVPVGLPFPEAFIDFIKELFLHEGTVIQMRGTASALMHTAVGDVPLNNMPFDNSLYLAGLDNFKAPGCIYVTNTDLIGGPEPNTALLNLTMNICNPSSATMYMGRIEMIMSYQGIVVGNGTIANMSLYAGPTNMFSAIANLAVTPENLPQVITFMSNFLRGQDLNVTLAGFEGGTDIYYAKKAFSHLKSPCTVPGFSQKLIVRADLSLSWKLFEGLLPTQLYLFNPFNTTVSLVGTSVTIYYQGIQIGHLNKDLHSSPIALPPNTHTMSPSLDATVDHIDISFLNSLFGTLPIDINGTLSVRVGDRFELDNVPYSQQAVPASFNRPTGPGALF